MKYTKTIFAEITYKIIVNANSIEEAEWELIKKADSKLRRIEKVLGNNGNIQQFEDYQSTKTLEE